MRAKAREIGVRIPDFCPLVNHDAVRAFHEIMQKDLLYMDVQARYVRLKARAAAGTA